MALLALISCKSGKSGKLLPSVSGKAGEVVVVMEKPAWEGECGAAVRDILASDTPYLAQREPLYNLVNVTPSNFVNLFQVHRNIVVFVIDPQAPEEGIKYQSDIWARPQCVIQVNAPTDARATEMVKENARVISETIEQAERDRIVANTLRYEEASIFPAVSEVIGGSPHFPSGYKLKKRTADFAWVADEKQYTMQGVLLYKTPALGDERDFSLERLVEVRNEVLRLNVPGMLDNSYMTTSTFLPPSVEFLKYKDRNFAQLRGFWEVSGDFMGGPFVSHSFYSADGQWVITEDAFVYAPKYDKRQYLRQVESLLYSFEWPEKGK